MKKIEEYLNITSKEKKIWNIYIILKFLKI